MNASGETRKTIVINEGFIDPHGTLIHSKRKSPANKTQRNIKPSPQSRELSKQDLQKIRDRNKNTPLATTRAESEPEQIPVATQNHPVVNEENRDLVQSIDFLEKLTQSVQSRTPHHETKPHELHRCYTPQYGCLKSGVLPTYRTLLNTTQKIRPIMPTTPLLYSPTVPSFVAQTQQVYNSGQTLLPKPVQNAYLTHNAVEKNDPLDQEIRDLSIRRQFAEIQQGVSGGTAIGATELPPQNNTLLRLGQNPENTPPPTQNYQKRTVRRTHRVGRSKRLPIVSVLLPNKTIRSKVATHSKTLKTLPMPQVKNSLVKTGMIKIGSDAPENVLREIYENMCLIGGPVMNYNPDVLYYNMLHK